MIQKITPYIYTLIFIWNTAAIFGQQHDSIALHIYGKNKLESQVILSLKYTRIFTDLNSLELGLKKIKIKLQKKGYYTLITDSIVHKNKQVKAYLDLGDLTKEALVELPNKPESQTTQSAVKKTLTIPIDKLSFFLDSLSQNSAKKGLGFTKFSLKNIKIKNNQLFAQLQVKKATKRTVDSIVVKGYDNFPKNFIKNYYQIDKNTVFNEAILKQVSEQNKALLFAAEIKPPEVLFTKDSTLLYNYLKKVPSSSFDGLVNFTSKAGKSGIEFNGYLTVALVNIFNRGESLKIDWKNNGQQKQSFLFGAKLPYLFNTKISSDIEFSIYKNDSTYLNTHTKITLTTSLNRKTSIGLYYESENSKDLLNNSLANIAQFSKYFIGAQYSFKNLSKNLFHLKTSIAIGSRSTENKETPQYKIDFTADVLLSTGTQTALFIRNESGYLISAIYLQNELYRLGGIHNFRGFKESSLFSSKYSYLNTEFRYKTANKSYLYTLFDLGSFNIQEKQQNLYALGLGYSFNTIGNLIDLSFTYGANPSATSNRFLNIKILTYF